MTKYKQLGQEQRYAIGRLLGSGMCQQEIADVIGVHKSTVSRELRRNTPKRGSGALIYNPKRAHEKAIRRHKEKPKRIRFDDCMKAQCCNWLRTNKLSPELMSAVGRMENPEFVSAETIYRWIWDMKKSDRRLDRPFKRLYKELKHGRRRRKRGNYHDKRGFIPGRVSIEERPKVVERRTRLGDLEIDLMLGKNHQPGLIVIVDRASLKTSLCKISTKASRLIGRKIIRKMAPFKDMLKTITYDNDQAFTQHIQINKALGTKSFFTHPYTSQEKGSVENRIGVLRRFFPKKTDFSSVTPNQIRKVEEMINERPVRKFNYRTPNAVFLLKQRVALMS
jgi:IS30 family transposase